eukprot:CAMPEP_0115715314 /NCGR_PEP_ID=MMETSP0272-20121206/75719_1 /TAXON_ID=71861 /ORGANISM="Scrippsiella trochoidea, Strain CCMP3099" /LENGTH=34 /DNA_ID= /DNA_START= /DNA_END= /DNA_ORIENTATION=
MADSDTAELLQLHKKSPGSMYNLRAYSGWNGVNA